MGEHSIDINENSFFIIPPFSLHKTLGNTPCERINIYISKDLINERNLKFLEQSSLCSFKLDKESVSILKTLLLSAMDLNPKTDIQTMQATINSVLFLIDKNKVFSTSISPLENIPKTLTQFINKNLNQHLSIQSLCKEFFVSKNVLYSWFKKYFNCTVNEYLLIARINKAQKLLTTTHLDMQSIAVQCGFNSANYFSLIYKRKTSISPTEFRRQNSSTFLK